MFTKIMALCLLAALPDFFINPRSCTPEELAQEIKGKTMDMCWGFGKKSHFRFVTQHHEVYFEIVLEDLPEQYADFVEGTKGKFVEKGKQLTFSYRLLQDGTEEVNKPGQQVGKASSDEPSYLVSERRVIDQASPELLNQEELENIIRGQNVLFYTGAGLSAASHVPTMNELHELLGLEANERFVYSLEKAVNNPRQFASNILIFHNACFSSPPSKAHLALKKLAMFKNVQIVTENLDCLHESSGIFAYRINAEQLRSDVGAESLAKTDYIICVGLSYDDRGFLGWYKEHNPQGKIIAIDLGQPSYLGDEDFLLSGDLQELLPTIAEKLVQP